MTDAGLTPDAEAAVVTAVEALPSDVRGDEALRAVPRLALLATHADAAAAYPIVVQTAERAELERVGPASETAPKPARNDVWLSVVAVVLALAGPALILVGRTGSAALDPVSGALPSGLCMAAALALFVWLEPRRTANPLYHGGNFGARMFVFIPVIWAVGIVMVLGESDDVLASGPAVVGLVLQVASTVGCLVLAVAAFRHDKERPDWAAGRAVRGGVPAEVAADPEFVAGVEGRLESWRRSVYRTSTGEERAALLAAELEALRLLEARGSVTSDERRGAERRVRDRSDWT